MSKPDFSKLAEQVPTLGLSDQARALASMALPADELYRWLIGASLHADAIRLLPHLLPKRRAVWWGCLCVWHAHRQALSPAAAAAIDATVRWVHRPIEEHRRACESSANFADLHTSAGCLAMAAFWSAGSMSRENLPPVAPPESLTAKAIAGAVLLAAAEQSPHQLNDHYRQFLEIGNAVAQGRLLWSSPAAAGAQESRQWELHGATGLPSPHARPATVIAGAPWHPFQQYSAEPQT